MTTDTGGRTAALEDLLCFDLYAASRAVTALYRPMLDELQLTYPQYLVLVLLHATDAPLTVSELAKELRLDHGTLTPLLRRMQVSGLVTRRRSTVDERVVQIGITAAGQQLHERFGDLQCRVVAAMGLTEPAARKLRSTLRLLTASVSTG